MWTQIILASFTAICYSVYFTHLKCKNNVNFFLPLSEWKTFQNNVHVVITYRCRNDIFLNYYKGQMRFIFHFFSSLWWGVLFLFVSPQCDDFHYIIPWVYFILYHTFIYKASKENILWLFYQHSIALLRNIQYITAKKAW